MSHELHAFGLRACPYCGGTSLSEAKLVLAGGWIWKSIEHLERVCYGCRGTFWMRTSRQQLEVDLLPPYDLSACACCAANNSSRDWIKETAGELHCYPVMKMYCRYCKGEWNVLTARETIRRTTAANQQARAAANSSPEPVRPTPPPGRLLREDGTVAEPPKEEDTNWEEI